MKTSKRILSFLLVISFLSAPLAQTTYAGSDYGASNWAVHYLEVAGQVAAAVVINRLTNTVINKVKNSGPNGGPAFIQNWINFTTQSQYQGEGVFRAVLGNTTLCNYFGDELKNLFGARAKPLLNQNTRVGSLDSFGLRAKCTLPSSFDMTKYQEDFAGNGGWEAWDRLLQPQNNYYGSLFQSLDEVSRQRSLAEQSNTNKAVSGKGYFGFGEKDCRVRVGNNCIVPGNIKTPPTTVEQAVSNALDNPVKYVSGANSNPIATAAISVVVTLVINRLFDMAGNSSEPDDSAAYGYSIPSPARTADSYKQEFCMAEDNISPDAGLWIKINYPQTWSSYPVEHQGCNGHTNIFGHHDDACGKSYCEQVRQEFEKNEYPYSRCTETCMNTLKSPPGVGLPGATFSPYPLLPTPTDGGGEGEPAPDDAAAKHGNHTSEVAEAKQELIDEGKVFPDPNATDECYRFEIVERAVPKIAGAGFLDKPGGNNCRGFAVDIIAFDDGYIYDVLVGSGDGSMPAWQPVGCGPVGGGGTCPDRYRSP